MLGINIYFLDSKMVKYFWYKMYYKSWLGGGFYSYYVFSIFKKINVYICN